MAELQELYTLTLTGSELRNKIVQGTLVVATEIILQTADLPTNHGERKSWAVAVVGNPEHWGAIMTRFLIAQYHEAEVSAIEGVIKEDLLAVIRAVVDVFAAEHAGATV